LFAISDAVVATGVEFDGNEVELIDVSVLLKLDLDGSVMNSVPLNVELILVDDSLLLNFELDESVTNSMPLVVEFDENSPTDVVISLTNGSGGVRISEALRLITLVVENNSVVDETVVWVEVELRSKDELEVVDVSLITGVEFVWISGSTVENNSVVDVAFEVEAELAPKVELEIVEVMLIPGVVLVFGWTFGSIVEENSVDEVAVSFKFEFASKVELEMVEVALTSAVETFVSTVEKNSVVDVEFASKIELELVVVSLAPEVEFVWPFGSTVENDSVDWVTFSVEAEPADVGVEIFVVEFVDISTVIVDWVLETTDCDDMVKFEPEHAGTLLRLLQEFSTMS